MQFADIDDSTIRMNDMTTELVWAAVMIALVAGYGAGYVRGRFVQARVYLGDVIKRRPTAAVRANVAH